MRWAALWVAASCLALPVIDARGSDLLRPPHKFIGKDNGIPNRWLVVLRDDLAAANGVEQLSSELSRRYGGTVLQRWEHSIQGFAIDLPPAAARGLAEHPWVEWVEQDQLTELADGTQASPPWGLDRVDQRDLPLSGSFYYPVTASGIDVYVIDSGIYIAHPEFGGRATEDFTAISDGRGAGDCNGHGTHVAGTIGSGTYGIAKKSKLHSVRVLDCSGNGGVSGVVGGVDWVTANHGSPAIANMSLSVPGGNITLNNAVQRSVDSGVTHVVAAANYSHDACLDSPARVGPAITVAATDGGDMQSSYSNFGSCVDIYAPGDAILSTWNNGGTNILYGTSMASPHVAGVAAMYVAWRPAAPPSEVANQIIGNATSNRLTGISPGSPNLLLYAPFMPSCTGGLEMCAGVCTSLANSSQNCGQCGRRCIGTGRKCFDPDGSWYYAGQMCSAGACVSNPCEF